MEAITVSYTQAYHAFADLSEEGANDMLAALFAASQHLLVYGSPPFVTSSSSAATLVSPISVPGLLQTPIPFEVQFSVPQLDLYPPDVPLPAPLVFNPGQFAVSTTATVSVLCGGQTMQTALDIWVVGRLVPRTAGGNVVAVGFEADQVDVANIAPDTLKSIINCVALQVLQGILSSVSIPVPALSGGFFSVTVQQGPQIGNDEIDVWGDV
jgi:hypothetical protein